jgi:hypothetical protein
MPYGMFTGCSCCGGDVCLPVAAEIGDISLEYWLFGHKAVGDTTVGLPVWDDPDAEWHGEIWVASTHTGFSYAFVWEQPFTRTFSLPSATTPDTLVANHWDHEDVYFSEPDAVHFTAAELRIYFSGGAEIMPASPEADALEAVLGHDPFTVTLSVWPIDSAIPTAVAGEVGAPDDFSDRVDFPDDPPWTEPDQEYTELTWAAKGWWNQDYWNGPGWTIGNSHKWGWAANSSLALQPYQTAFTYQPRGYTFLTSGLLGLDQLIHEFEDGTTDALVKWEGFCTGLYRLNAFFENLTIGISGADWDSGPPGAPGDPEDNIMQGMNDTYSVEFSDTDLIHYKGKGTHWLVKLTVLPPVIDFATATEGGDPPLDPGGLTLQFMPLHGEDNTKVGTRFYQTTAGSLTNNDMLALAGVGSYQDAGQTIGYISDPTEFAKAIHAESTWGVSVPDPFALWDMDSLTITLA